MQVFVSGWELTEVSQAGQSGGLQPPVVGEGVAGSDRHPLDAVQHQDAVVALCGGRTRQNERSGLGWSPLTSGRYFRQSG